MFLYGLVFTSSVVIFLAWMERDHWREFRVARELDRDHQVLEATQATLQKEKESSESMCQELAIGKVASEKLMTQLKAEKQAVEALLGMVCDSSFWLSSDGDTVSRSEARFDAMMGSIMVVGW